MRKQIEKSIAFVNKNSFTNLLSERPIDLQVESLLQAAFFITKKMVLPKTDQLYDLTYAEIARQMDVTIRLSLVCVVLLLAIVALLTLFVYLNQKAISSRYLILNQISIGEILERYNVLKALNNVLALNDFNEKRFKDVKNLGLKHDQKTIIKKIEMRAPMILVQILENKLLMAIFANLIALGVVMLLYLFWLQNLRQQFFAESETFLRKTHNNSNLSISTNMILLSWVDPRVFSHLASIITIPLLDNNFLSDVLYKEVTQRFLATKICDQSFN